MRVAAAFQRDATTASAGTGTTVRHRRAERRHLRAIRKIADLVIDTTKFNVHELRAHLTDRFKQQSGSQQTILVSCVSFGYKHGLPDDADLVFDVRFLPNPHFVPEFRALTGRHPGSRNTSDRFRRHRSSSTASPNC